MSLKSIWMIIPIITVYSQSALSQDDAKCTGPELNALMELDLKSLRAERLEANFARAMGGAEVDAFYENDDVRVIKASFLSDAGKADMNFYIQSSDDYLMEYHIIQNSNYFGEPDSVVLTDEKSYYHVCDDQLLAPAFGGIINEEIYDNMKLVLDIIMTEVKAN